MLDNLIAQFKFLHAKLMPDNAGQSVVRKIVGIAVGILVAILVLPVAFNQIGGVNSENWGSGGDAIETILTVLLPILAAVSVALYMVDRD